MTTLYRSPNLVIDEHQWHVAVVHHRGVRPTVIYRFRRSFRERWQDKAKWEGRMPVGFNYLFRPFMGHVRLAVESVDYEPSRRRKAERRPVRELAACRVGHPRGRDGARRAESRQHFLFDLEQLARFVAALEAPALPPLPYQ